MRKISTISIHCTASDSPAHDNVETIMTWHVKERGFLSIGYHYLITKDGVVHKTRPLREPCAAVKGFNDDMVAICLTGKYAFSNKQFIAARKVVRKIMKSFTVSLSQILPHNHWNKDKTCPNFDIKLITGHLDDVPKE